MKVEKIIESFPLHYYVWNNDYNRLNETLNSGKVNIESMDARGNTPLMLAIRLGHIESVRVLLQHRANASAASVHHWTVDQEAVSYGDPELLKLILLHRDGQRVQSQASSISSLLKKLQTTADFYVEMKWEFASWLPQFSRLCPNDICRIWKKGSSVRVDTTLLGMSANNTWLKGNLSYIFQLTPDNDGVIVDEVNHSQGTIYRHELLHSRDQAGYLSHAPAEEFITRKLSQPIFVTYLDMDKVEFEKSKSGILAWRSDKKEDVLGHECQVYTANNVQVITLHRTEHLSDEEKSKLREGHGTSTSSSLSANAFASFVSGLEPTTTGQDDTINKTSETQRLIKTNSTNPSEIKSEEYFDSTFDLGLRELGRHKEMALRAKSYKAHLWTCNTFPLSLKDQLMPVIDLLSEYNPYFHRLKEFFSMQLPNGFPIKIEIPLYHILHARITFTNLHACDKTVEGVKYFASEAAEARASDVNAITIEHASGDKPTTKGKCKIESEVFLSPSVYRLQSETCPAHNGGIWEEDQMIQMALQQNLIDYGQLDPKTKKTHADGEHRKSLTTDAREYYGEEDAMLQRAIEASLCDNVKKMPSIGGGGQPTSTSLEDKKRQEKEDEEFQRVLEMSKQDH